MLNDRNVGGGQRPYFQKLFQTFFFRAWPAMTPQQHQAQGGASCFAATAVNQNAHDIIGWTPFLKMVQRTLNQRRLGRWSSQYGRLDIVASEYDLPMSPFGPDFNRQPGRTALLQGNAFVARMFNRDHDRKREVVSLVGFNQVHNFRRFADGEI